MGSTLELVIQMWDISSQLQISSTKGNIRYAIYLLLALVYSIQFSAVSHCTIQNPCAWPIVGGLGWNKYLLSMCVCVARLIALTFWWWKAPTVLPVQ